MNRQTGNTGTIYDQHVGNICYGFDRQTGKARTANTGTCCNQQNWKMDAGCDYVYCD